MGDCRLMRCPMKWGSPRGRYSRWNTEDNKLCFTQIPMHLSANQMHCAHDLRQMHDHAAMVFDAAACLSPQVMPLDKAVGSHSKRPSTSRCLTIRRLTPPSFEPVVHFIEDKLHHEGLACPVSERTSVTYHRFLDQGSFSWFLA